ESDDLAILLEAGKVPASISYIAQMHLHAPAEFRNGWKGHDFFTLDAVVNDGRGNAKLVLDYPGLRLSDDASLVQPSPESWHFLQGKKVMALPRKKINDLLGNGYSFKRGKYIADNEEVKDFWSFVTRGEIDVDDYAQKVGKASGGKSVIMKLWFRSDYSDRVAFPLRISNMHLGSEIDGVHKTDHKLAYFVGLNPNRASLVESIDYSSFRNSIYI
ncbi:MAG: hypothetical protein AABX05_05260, partial [Nanoarchaeota archaeon]